MSAAGPAVEFAPGPRAVLGCVEIPTDFVLDQEGPALIQLFPGVELRLTKMAFEPSSGDAITAETFEAAEANVGRAAQTLLPTDRQTVLGVACTSLSFTLGPGRIDAQLRRGSPGCKTTDMARAQAAALEALGVTRVGLVTPYIEKLSEANAEMLERSGRVTVVSRATMGLETDSQTSAVTVETIGDWAVAVDCEQAQAVVIGCSAFRACSAGFIDELEGRLGKPVVTSTQAFLWSMLRTAGVTDRVDGYGQLFKRY